MKKFFFSSAIVLCALLNAKSQNLLLPAGPVGIGTLNPESSAALEIKSQSKGILLPRMTESKRKQIASPATGLVVFQTDGVPGFYYYLNGWKSLAASGSFANANLSNVSTTAITQSLLPAVSGARNLGSSSKKWKDLFISGNISAGNLAAESSVIKSLNVGEKGIVVDDPSNNYVLTSDKTGENAGIAVTKSSPFSSTACIVGISTGSAPGLGGFSSLGNGVNGISDHYSGIHGYSAYYTGGTFFSDNGDGLRAFTLNGSYAGVFEGDVVANNLYLTSDKNLKQNIKELDSATLILSKLKPRFYEFSTESKYNSLHLPKGMHYGLLAQDVEEILPGLVKKSTHDISVPKPATAATMVRDNGIVKTQKQTIEIKAVNYTELIPVMIKGMQEQETKITRLEARIEALTQLVNKLTAAPGIVLTKTTEPYLGQNTPNPPAGFTKVNYNIPTGTKKAALIITDNNGRTIQYLDLKNSGDNYIDVSTSSLGAGTYYYSLNLDGRIVKTRKMIVVP